MKVKKPQNYLDDLDQLYELALGKKDISNALKIKEMQIKKHQEDQDANLNEISDDQLDLMIKRIEARLGNVQEQDLESH